MQMQSKSKIEEKISGWDYIDDVIFEILDMLPQDDRAMYFRTFKALYGAGIVEGRRLNKLENKNNYLIMPLKK